MALRICGITLALTATFLGTAAILNLSIQAAITAVVCLLSVTTLSAENSLLLLVVIMPFGACLRRLLAPSGYLAFDPLAALPLLLLLIVVVKAALHHWQGKAFRSLPTTYKVAILLLVIGMALSFIFTRNTSLADLYSALYELGALALIPLVASGRLLIHWELLTRIIPVLGLPVGVYGLIQFFVLPVWDSRWMTASMLTSIGSPEPMQVRVFSTLESPGPAAAYLGLAIVLSIARATRSRGGRRLFWITLGLLDLPAFILTGVRSTLLALFLAVVLVLFLQGRGVARAVPLLLGGALYGALSFTLTALAGTSQILSSSRYSDFDPSTDISFQARIQLFSYLRNLPGYLIGTPAAYPVDSLFFDQLVAYGVFGFASAICLAVFMLGSAARIIRTRLDPTLSSVLIYGLVFAFAVDIFAFSFGVIVSIALAHFTRISQPCVDRVTEASESDLKSCGLASPA